MDIMSVVHVDVVCSLADQQFAFRGHDGSSTAVNRPHCAEFLNVFNYGGPLLEIYLNLATVIQFQIAICFSFHEICFSD